MLASFGRAVNMKQSKVIPVAYLQLSGVWKLVKTRSFHSMKEKSLITTIIKYLQNDKFPLNKNRAWQTMAKAAKFCTIDGKLYKRSCSGPYLQFIENVEVKHVLAKLHEGKCHNHSGAEALHTVHNNADRLSNHVKKCDQCRWFIIFSRLPLK